MNSHAQPAPSTPLLVAVAVCLALVLPVPAAEWLRPTQRTSDIKGPVDLAAQVPRSLGDWREDQTVRPLLPDPALQATLDQSYSQVLARTYINPLGQRVMLSVAYGNDQSSKATAVHAPEFCYRSQGFEVVDGGEHVLKLGGHSLRAQRLLARQGPRVEPITYWVTLDEAATLPGWRRKLQQLQLGLGGVIADGMVVRVSTLGLPDADSYDLQARFLSQWFSAMPADVRHRYFGAPAGQP
jgi:EpsI family protein